MIDQKAMRMVRAIAAQYSKYGASFDDLVQEGLIGYMEAHKRYDPTKGAGLSTYAPYWVKKKILQFLDTEIKFRSRTVELNEGVVSGEIAEPAEVETKINLPDDMPSIEQKIIRQVYEENRSLTEISNLLGIRRERIRQIKQKAMRRLRLSVEAEGY